MCLWPRVNLGCALCNATRLIVHQGRSTPLPTMWFKYLVFVESRKLFLEGSLCLAFVDHGVDVLFRPMHGSCWSISYAQLLSNASRATISSCCMPSLVFVLSARGSTRQLFCSSLHLASAVPRQSQS